MTATLVKHDGDQVTIQFTVTLTGQMLNDERALQDSLMPRARSPWGRCSNNLTPKVNRYGLGKSSIPLRIRRPKPMKPLMAPLSLNVTLTRVAKEAVVMCLWKMRRA